MYYSPQSAQRNKGEILVYLSPSSSQPAPAVPFEVSSQIPADKWAARCNAISSLAGRFSKPMFERVWLTIGLVLTLAVPIALHQLIRSKLDHDSERGSALPHIESSAIGFAIFIAMGSLVILPMAIWKYSGYRQVNAQVRRWVQADRQQYGQNTVDWKVQTPGVFNNRLTLTVILPPSLIPTVFHPDAYLPSYINAPNDVDAVYYYPFKGEPGLPRMSVVGNVPIYTDEKRQFAEV